MLGNRRAERPDGHGLILEPPLRGHGRQLAREGKVHGDAERIDVRPWPLGGVGLVLLPGSEALLDKHGEVARILVGAYRAKVNEPDGAVPGEEDVVRAQIPMAEPHGVERLQGIEHRSDDP